MIDQTIVASRIEAVEECLQILQKYLYPKMTPQIGSFEMQLLIERCVERIIQSMLDIGTHIISVKRLGRPERYDDILKILTENKILPPDFSDGIRGLAGLRNLIVHEYLVIDPDLLKKHAKSLLEDAPKYIRFIKDFVAQEKSGSSNRQ